LVDSLGDEVTSELAAIPPDYQTAIVLCDIEGYSYEEIAELMDTPIGTIRSRIHRGRKMLAIRLSEYANDLGFA
jgi:RNA polymerase sigma-70 factor (ECF subfamily)